ncbi:hypothetical protein [uncultured Alistipes sp.]|uniref:hypothetical protein n=1 Tax=uncultured Alistipes sp. TaxID=538949 RepID=UPI00261D15F7|nr:hypothetical protein [uncultured Alistipes sp.]
MEEQTLKELYTTLDPNGQANLIRFFGEKLFVAPTTALYYLRGYRSVPKKKQEALAEYAKKTHTVKLIFP